MGESIEKTSFTENEAQQFKDRLRQETLILKKLLEARDFDFVETPNIGLEAEAWLLDKNSVPNPINKEFLEHCNNPMVVEEISRFNFELNTEVYPLAHNCFVSFQKEIMETWSQCCQSANDFDSHPLFIGIHPMVRNEMLQPEFISEGSRYEALNKQVLRLRQQKSINIDIRGRDHLQLSLDHILIEAAATSIQVHIQCNQEDFKRVYNASLISSIAGVAVAANSPFLYGHDLWAETRIPLFEQAVALKQFRDKKGKDIGRVTFGTGYVEHSTLELFLENLDGYSVLLPILFDDAPEKMHHLRFHNGTLWRWNRPIIGFSGNGKPHFRIEQRAMASGPSVVDMIANTCFSVGLTQYFARSEKVPEESMTFTDCRNNFYAAAKDGLAARVRWFGKNMTLDRLILQDLLPKAKLGLKAFGLSESEIDHYLDDVIKNRVLSGQTGAKWQRSFVNTHGKDFQALSESYRENQNSGKAVHEWQIPR